MNHENLKLYSIYSWYYHYVTMYIGGMSNIPDVVVLADSLTQCESDKKQTKTQLKGRQVILSKQSPTSCIHLFHQRNVVKSYPQIQREKKEEKELQKKEEVVLKNMEI